MQTINSLVENTIIINKSTFITYLKPIETLSDAKAYLQEIKLKHPNANHHVCCYIIGKTGEIGSSNDDGEPSGTAGLPAFNVFKNNDITNFICIIVRYFGGIKLGAGGLVRAYSKSASEALKLTSIIPIIDYCLLQLNFDYCFLDLIENRLKTYQIISKSFNTNITMIIKLPLYEVEMVRIMLIQMTNNLIKINLINEEKTLD